MYILTLGALGVTFAASISSGFTGVWRAISIGESFTGSAEAAACIAAGKTEADSMSLADSVYVMAFMDDLRKRWGMVYPQEQ